MTKPLVYNYRKMTKEELYEVIDELKYNIKDGISIPGCRFRFSTDTYEGAIGALTLLKQRVEKWNHNDFKTYYLDSTNWEVLFEDGLIIVKRIDWDKENTNDR